MNGNPQLGRSGTGSSQANHEGRTTICRPMFDDGRTCHWHSERVEYINSKARKVEEKKQYFAVALMLRFQPHRVKIQIRRFEPNESYHIKAVRFFGKKRILSLHPVTSSVMCQTGPRSTAGAGHRRCNENEMSGRKCAGSAYQ